MGCDPPAHVDRLAARVVAPRALPVRRHAGDPVQPHVAVAAAGDVVALRHRRGVERRRDGRAVEVEPHAGDARPRPSRRACSLIDSPDAPVAETAMSVPRDPREGSSLPQFRNVWVRCTAIPLRGRGEGVGEHVERLLEQGVGHHERQEAQHVAVGAAGERDHALGAASRRRDRRRTASRCARPRRRARSPASPRARGRRR